MESHDLFKQLAGNPLSICILASFHKSDFFTNNDLASIYKRMTNQKSEHDETQEDEQDIHCYMQNRISLCLSTEATISLL